MKRGDLWDAFATTGRIEDYLRYRGIDIYNPPPKEKKEHADNDRRAHHPGKQQYW